MTEKRIDLLLAEFSALGTSGVELVRWFSANRPEIRVLVASDWLWEVESCLGDLPRVGVLALGAADSAACNRTDPLWEAFQQGLRDLGYVEGQNLRIEYRCGDFQHEQLLALAKRLEGLG